MRSKLEFRARAGEYQARVLSLLRPSRHRFVLMVGIHVNSLYNIQIVFFVCICSSPHRGRGGSQGSQGNQDSQGSWGSWGSWGSQGSSGCLGSSGCCQGNLASFSNFPLMQLRKMC